MADNNFNETVESLFKGMDSFLTTKTVVGEAIKFDDGTIVLPLVDVSFVWLPVLSATKKNQVIHPHLRRTMVAVVWVVRSSQVLSWSSKTVCPNW